MVWEKHIAEEKKEFLQKSSEYLNSIILDKSFSDNEKELLYKIVSLIIYNNTVEFNLKKDIDFVGIFNNYLTDNETIEKCYLSLSDYLTDDDIQENDYWKQMLWSFEEKNMIN